MASRNHHLVRKVAQWKMETRVLALHCDIQLSFQRCLVLLCVWPLISNAPRSETILANVLAKAGGSINIDHHETVLCPAELNISLVVAWIARRQQRKKTVIKHFPPNRAIRERNKKRGTATARRNSDENISFSRRAALIWSSICKPVCSFRAKMSETKNIFEASDKETTRKLQAGDWCVLSASATYLQIFLWARGGEIQRRR